MVVSFRNLNSRRDEDLFRNEEVLGEIGERFWDIYSLLLLFFLISIVEFTKVRKIFYP